MSWTGKSTHDDSRISPVVASSCKADEATAERQYLACDSAIHFISNCDQRIRKFGAQFLGYGKNKGDNDNLDLADRGKSLRRTVKPCKSYVVIPRFIELGVLGHET